MALSPKLEIRQGQALVMTPQLRQAIKLLGMSGPDLADYVAAEVERNPLLELAAPPPTAAPAPRMAGRQDDGRQLEGIVAEVTLWEQLRAQIGAMRISAEDAELTLLLADELEEDGYLRVPLAEIAARHRVRPGDAARCLRLLQSCEPAGIGARGLAECLALQLRERGRLDPAIQALLDNLHLVAAGRHADLQSVCGVDAEDVEDMLAELRALDPKPGLRFSSAPVQTAVPDVYVQRDGNGGWAVELNTESLPRVLLSNVYAARLAGGGREARVFVSEMRASASWLMRSLEQRARTILSVSAEIVRQQEGFFGGGVENLRPLTQRAVADRLGIHESTVSRVTAGKFLACAHGTFELRYFFGSAIKAVLGGEDFSALAVQRRIRLLVSREGAARTLSDDKIVELLRTEGIDIARRTVAKYRELMGIPSSVERRRLRGTRSKVHSAST